MSKRTNGIAVGAVLAAAAGYVAGILTAPKSGKETREDIANTAAKAKTEAERKLKQLHHELDNVIAEGKKRAIPMGQAAKAEIEEAVRKAVAAKEKARQTLSAIHEGESDDKDLDKIVKEVSSTLEDLKAYISRTDKKV